MPTTHELKTLPAYWDAVNRGDKNFEVRRDDRGFQKGDIVKLVKLSHLGLTTNHTITRRIRYILTGGQFGIEPGYVVLQLEEIDAD